METATSYPCSKKPAIFPKTEPDKSNSHPLTLFLYVLASPRMIFNGDKSSLEFFPKSGKVLAYERDKSVYEVNRGLSIASTTLVFAFSASVMMHPSMLI